MPISPSRMAALNMDLIRIPQARVLRALMPSDDCIDEQYDWPLLGRPELCKRAGFTVLSGTVTRAMNGIREGSSSGAAQKGLLERKLVEIVMVDVDGVKDKLYRITKEGIKQYQRFINSGGKLPKVKDKDLCTNDRYLEEE